MRLFVAVWPPPELVEVLASLHRPEVAGLRWTGPEQWHVTLHFLGDADPAVAAEAFHRIQVVGAASVVAEAGPVTGRFGRRILHVPVEGLKEVAEATVRTMAGVGETPEDRPFKGHITLARARHPGGVNLRPLAGAPVSCRWVVGELTLVASHLGGGKPARYEVVERLAI